MYLRCPCFFYAVARGFPKQRATKFTFITVVYHADGRGFFSLSICAELSDGPLASEGWGGRGEDKQKGASKRIVETG